MNVAAARLTSIGESSQASTALAASGLMLAIALVYAVFQVAGGSVTLPGESGRVASIDDLGILNIVQSATRQAARTQDGSVQAGAVSQLANTRPSAGRSPSGSHAAPGVPGIHPGTPPTTRAPGVDGSQPASGGQPGSGAGGSSNRSTLPVDPGDTTQTVETVTETVTGAVPDTGTPVDDVVEDTGTTVGNVVEGAGRTVGAVDDRASGAVDGATDAVSGATGGAL